MNYRLAWRARVATRVMQMNYSQLPPERMEDWIEDNPRTSTRIVTDIEMPVALLRDPARVDIVRGVGGWKGHIEAHPNYRQPGEWQRFVDMVRKNGIHPITVAVEQDGRITIIDGTHRLEAAELLGMKTIPVKELMYMGGSDRYFRLDDAADVGAPL